MELLVASVTGGKDSPEKRSGNFWATTFGVWLFRSSVSVAHWTRRIPALCTSQSSGACSLLAVGTALATVDWDVTHLFFGFQILKDGFYIVYELVLDILGLLVIIGLGMAIYRRYISRPARLQNLPVKSLTGDDLFVLVMLTFITLSGYLTEGLRIAVTQPSWARLVTDWQGSGFYIYCHRRPNQSDTTPDHLVDPYPDRLRCTRQPAFHQIIPHLLSTDQYLLPLLATRRRTRSREHGKRNGCKGMEAVYLETIA